VNRLICSVVSTKFRPQPSLGRGGPIQLYVNLEFKAVVVMACDDDVLPLQSCIEGAADEVELDDVYETERQL
jgi:hypothetical protein